RIPLPVTPSLSVQPAMAPISTRGSCACAADAARTTNEASTAVLLITLTSSLIAPVNAPSSRVGMVGEIAQQLELEAKPERGVLLAERRRFRRVLHPRYGLAALAVFLAQVAEVLVALEQERRLLPHVRQPFADELQRWMHPLAIRRDARCPTGGNGEK